MNDTITVLPATFDYAALDAETRIVVQQRTGEIRTIARRAASDIIEIGQKLSDVKDRLGHGRFGSWLEAEFAWQERTARSFMAVAEKFKSANIADLNFAPTALYLLASSSVPDEARQEAVDRAAQGEHIGIGAARAIIGKHMATADELRPHVLAWAQNILPADPRSVLRQIALNNTVGLSHFMRLDEWCRTAGVRFLRAELRNTVNRLVEELPLPTARIGIIESQPTLGEVAAALDRYLSPMCANRGEKEILLADVLARREPWWTRACTAPTLPPHTEADSVAAAARSLLDSPSSPPTETAERPAAAGPAAAGRCSICHRPLTDPAHVAQGCGPVCAGKNGNGNGGNGNGSGASPLTGGSLPTRPAADEPDLPAIVEAWLQAKVDALDLPDDKGSLRFALQQVIAARNGANAEIWRDFRTFEGWPRETQNDEKLAAAAAVLARLAGQPAPISSPVDRLTPARPINIQESLVERQRLRIRQLSQGLKALLVFVEAQAAGREPDPDTIAAIAAATATLRDPTYA